MGLTTCYRASHLNLESCYVKILRIWGSKQEGWNAWFGIFNAEGDQEPVEKFSLMTPYVEDANPFTLLYKEAEKLSFLNAPVSAPVVEEVKPVEQPKVDAEKLVADTEEKIKKTRAKKK